MSEPPKSQTRIDFETAARSGDWTAGCRIYNGLDMTEQLLAYKALSGADRAAFKRFVASQPGSPNLLRMQYAFGIVDDGQMPLGAPPGDLRATGQEEDAREFVAPVPAKLKGFLFADLLAQYPQGSPEQAKTSIGGHVDEDWIANTCAVRISRVLNYSGVKVPHGDNKTLAVVAGADHQFYSFRQKELRAFFKQHFGAPSLSFGKSPDRRKLWNLQGFIGFDIAFADATGHIDLWDGSTFQLEAQATHDYFAMATHVDFWRVPSLKRP